MWCRTLCCTLNFHFELVSVWLFLYGKKLDVLMSSKVKLEVAPLYSTLKKNQLEKENDHNRRAVSNKGPCNLSPREKTSRVPQIRNLNRISMNIYEESSTSYFQEKEEEIHQQQGQM